MTLVIIGDKLIGSYSLFLQLLFPKGIKEGFAMYTTKIALTGFARSGKTVFLTSLLWHLMAYNESPFSLGDNCQKFEAFRKRPDMEKLKGPLFPFEDFQNCLGERVWPDRTSDLQYYYLQCRHTLGTIDRIKRWATLDFTNKSYIDFMDFPGERLGDLPIHNSENFSDWSKFIFTQSGFEEYLDKLESLDNNETDDTKFEKQAIALYKRCIVNFFLNSRSLVSPASIILRDINEKYVFSEFANENSDKKEENLIEWVVEKGVSGYEPEKEFCPLPDKIIESRPEVYKSFSQNFNVYKNKYVYPFFNELLSVDSMAILIDIPDILQSGSKKKQDQFNLLELIFHKLPWSICSKRIAFVASKADLVGEKNQEALDNLLRSLVRSLDFDKRTITDCFICSACHSIYHNQGYPNSDKSGELMSINFDDLPKNWPMNWARGSFSFTRVRPNTEPNSLIPPNQFNLDKVFNFLMDNNK